MGILVDLLLCTPTSEVMMMQIWMSIWHHNLITREQIFQQYTNFPSPLLSSLSLSLAPITWMSVFWIHVWEMGFLHFIEYTWTWSNGLLKASKLNELGPKMVEFLECPCYLCPNPYISTTLGSRVVVWVFEWLVNDTQNANFANPAEESGYLNWQNIRYFFQFIF